MAKRKVDWRGRVLVIENEPGTRREWRDAAGAAHSTELRFPYGYFEGCAAADGDELDVYVGPVADARFVYVVHQLDAGGFYDEDKVFVDFADEAAAKVAYLAHRDDGERCYGGMSSMLVADFLAKLDRRTSGGKVRHSTMAAPAGWGPVEAWVNPRDRFDPRLCRNCGPSMTRHGYVKRTDLNSDELPGLKCGHCGQQLVTPAGSPTPLGAAKFDARAAVTASDCALMNVDVEVKDRNDADLVAEIVSGLGYTSRWPGGRVIEVDAPTSAGPQIRAALVARGVGVWSVMTRSSEMAASPMWEPKVGTRVSVWAGGFKRNGVVVSGDSHSGYKVRVDNKTVVDATWDDVDLPLSMSASSPTVTFDSRRGADGRVRAGVWDRVCVPGFDQKDGMATEFTVATMSQMVDNFARRGDPVPVDHNHQSNYAAQNGMPAPALAWYGALAVVDRGRVVKSHALAGVAPGSDGLDLAKDGLWAYRTEVTEEGDRLLPNFKLLSPTFTPRGVARDGSEVGYVLAAVAATNTPWQSGTAITFGRGRSAHAGDLMPGDTVITDEGTAVVVEMDPRGRDGVLKVNGVRKPFDVAPDGSITFSRPPPTYTGRVRVVRGHYAGRTGTVTGGGRDGYAQVSVDVEGRSVQASVARDDLEVVMSAFSARLAAASRRSFARRMLKR